MDGVTGPTQPAIQPGKTFVYEFVARRPAPSCTTTRRRNGADGDGHDGLLGHAPERPNNPMIDEGGPDFCFLLNAYDIDPGSARPRSAMTMMDFNLWTWNSRIFRESTA